MIPAYIYQVMPTLEEELAEIRTLPTSEPVARRIRARKVQYGRIKKQVEEFAAKLPETLNPRELQRKAAELDRALKLSNALFYRKMDRIGDDDVQVETVEDNQAQSESEHLALSDAVTDLGQQHGLAQKMALLQDDLQRLINQGEPAAAINRTEFQWPSTVFNRVKLAMQRFRDVGALSDQLEALRELSQRYKDSLKETLDTPAGMTPTTSTTNTTIHHSSRLRLDLPKFHGDPTEWVSFKAIFTAAMDKEGLGLTDQEKCMHLLGCMTMTAAKQTVRQYAALVNGYADAIQALEDTYGGSWRVYPIHVAVLVKAETYTYTAESLRQMRETIDLNLKGLKQHKGDNLESFLGTLFVSRFDKTMAYEWGIHWADNDKLPTIQEVRDFFPEEGSLYGRATHHHSTKVQASTKEVRKNQSCCHCIAELTTRQHAVLQDLWWKTTLYL